MDVNVRNSIGIPALFWAAINNNIDIVKLLLERGADVNLKPIIAGENPSIMPTPLIAASYFGHLETVQTLLEKGADLNVKGVIPHETAVPINALEAALLRKHKDVAGILRNKGLLPSFQIKGFYLLMDKEEAMENCEKLGIVCNIVLLWFDSFTATRHLPDVTLNILSDGRLIGLHIAGYGYKSLNKLFKLDISYDDTSDEDFIQAIMLAWHIPNMSYNAKWSYNNKNGRTICDRCYFYKDYTKGVLILIRERYKDITISYLDEHALDIK